MRIFDTFLFNDELDVLRMRLEELAGKVDRHVLVEARYDHQGNPKPLYYGENRDLFAPWSDRITHVIADVPTRAEDGNPWAREYAQRMAVWRGLDGDVEPADLVLVCDVDEIPSDTALSLKPDGPVAMGMRLAMFAVDWVHPYETRIAIAGRAKDLVTVPLFSLRDNGPRGQLPLVDGCGWHFTWLGGPAAIERKASQFCHLELREMILEGNAAGEWYEQGYTWHGISAVYPPPRRSFRLDPVEVDGAWPAYIRERRCPAEWFRLR
jgi:beta-1,4-mannosyl-glycoprotein beta-1,4-N-acetylglucosaminyltransferase